LKCGWCWRWTERSVWRIMWKPRSIRNCHKGEEYPTYNTKKAKWIGHMLHRNWLLKCYWR
jgi:hypothetical protein